MSFFRELTFRTSGPLQQEQVEAQAEDLPGVYVLLVRSRALGIFERHELRRPEFLTKMVLEIDERYRTLRDSAPDHDDDPYRGTFYEFITKVRPDILHLVESLPAEQKEVTRGRIDFRTRAYEPRVRQMILDELRPRCEQHQVDLKIELDHGILGEAVIEGRLLGPVVGIHAVRPWFRANPFIDADDVIVEYA